jgi:hypothetical protein
MESSAAADTVIEELSEAECRRRPALLSDFGPPE